MTCSADLDLGFTELSPVQLVTLGVVQGVTELLPVSSTAHLRIVPGLLGWRDPGTAFSAAMQLASLAAVLVYFRADAASLLRGAWHLLTGKRRTLDAALAWSVGLGTVPVGLGGLLLKRVLNQCGSPLRSLLVVGVASMVMAGLLAASEAVKKGGVRKFSQTTLRDGLLVGAAQALALIPGVSRSGATLTAGLWLGLRREDAARYSFVLGLPAIVLAGVYELFELSRAPMPSHGWGSLWLALAAATASAFVAIFGLMKFLEQRSTWGFVWYRLALGLGLVAAFLGGWAA